VSLMAMRLLLTRGVGTRGPAERWCSPPGLCGFRRPAGTPVHRAPPRSTRRFPLAPMSATRAGPRTAAMNSASRFMVADRAGSFRAIYCPAIVPAAFLLSCCGPGGACSRGAYASGPLCHAGLGSRRIATGVGAGRGDRDVGKQPGRGRGRENGVHPTRRARCRGRRPRARGPLRSRTGAICEKCDRAIEATQVARRHGERYARPAASAGLLGLREQSVQVARAATL